MKMADSTEPGPSASSSHQKDHSLQDYIETSQMLEVFIRWNGTVEWNGGMDYWNGIVEWPRPRNAAWSASWVVKSMIIGPLAIMEHYQR